jgi:hypothetical protein
VEREIRGPVQAIKHGVSALSIKNELMSLEARRAELKQHLEAPEMPQLLHPRTADVYWEEVTSRNNVLIANTPNDNGYTDSINARGGGSYIYRVCEAGTSTCSNSVTMSF